ncbi:MAG TPA: hypothetical protein DCR81_08085, partial [Smithella sp.]|nr:hypothetical protein [Smithella sp.]
MNNKKMGQLINAHLLCCAANRTAQRISLYASRFGFLRALHLSISEQPLNLGSLKNPKISAVSVICLLFLLSFMTANAVFAQGHAGHTMQAPAVVEKQKTAKPQTPQPAPPEEMTEETPQVEISSEQQQLIGAKTVKVYLKPIQKVIRTVGRIEADERKQTTINTKVEGWIEKLHVDYTGRYVRKGEPLVEIYSPELLATQQEFLGVLKWAQQPGDKKKDDTLSVMLAKDADAALDAARQRLRLWDISEEQIKQIQQSGKPVRTLTLYSPVSGFVKQKTAVQGMKVMPGEKLFDIADLSTLWIIAD